MRWRPAGGAALAVSLFGAGLVVPSAQCAAAVPATAETQALDALITDPDLRRLYEAGDWRLLWTRDQPAQLGRALSRANRHAISVDAIRPRSSPGDPPHVRDAELSRAALAYARALAQGVTDPKDSHGIFTLRLSSPDLVAGLSQALLEGRVEAWLDALPPQDAEYRALSAAYLRERSAIGERRVRIADGSLLRVGESDQRVPALAKALAQAGWPVEPRSQTFDRRMAAAVRAFQESAGLRVDGVVGPATIAALNAGPYERARQLAVNLERRRWLTRDPAPTRIDVNIAAARLTYMRDGAIDWRGRVVAGAPGHETPQLGEEFDHLVVNPPWYVPESIARAEILPKGQAYLAANDMYVDDGRVIQRPGPQAALGQVKFDMQNRYAIYLHDTPAKALFEASARHRSHGCVRVEDAVAFARRLATQRGLGETFDAALESGDTTVVELGEAITVRLFYHTAYVEDGAVRFRPDVYGWDQAVAQGLGLPGDGPRVPVGATAVLGP